MPSVEIYTTRYCPYCVQAKALLKRKGVAFTEIDVGQDWERRNEMVERAQGRRVGDGQRSGERAQHATSGARPLTRSVSGPNRAL